MYSITIQTQYMYCTFGPDDSTAVCDCRGMGPADTPYQMYSITIQTQYMYCTFGYLLRLPQLSSYPIKTRLALSGTLVVARDIAHAKLKAVRQTTETHTPP